MEEVTKTFYFKRENNDFSDILKDGDIKKHTRYHISYQKNLIIIVSDAKVISYVELKYGHDSINFNDNVPDRTPIVKQDYYPSQRISWDPKDDMFK